MDSEFLVDCTDVEKLATFCFPCAARLPRGDTVNLTPARTLIPWCENGSARNACAGGITVSPQLIFFDSVEKGGYLVTDNSPT